MKAHVCNEASHVIGLHGRGDTRFLFSNRIWELAKVAPSCHTVLDMLYQKMHEAWWLFCGCRTSLCVKE